MSEKREFALGALRFLLVSIITILSGYVTHLWIARYLGPASYGVFGVIMSLYHILIPFVQASFPKAASKFMAESQQDAASVFKTALKCQVLFAIALLGLLLVFSGALASYGFHDQSLKKYFQFLAVMILPLSLYYFYFEGYLNGLRRFREEAYGKTFFILLRTALIFLFVLLGFGVFGVLWGHLISLVASVIIFASWWNFPKINGKKYLSAQTITHFAVLTALSAIGLMLLRNIDVLLVKSLILDNIQVGFYVAASTLASVPYLLFSSLGGVMLPSISKAVSEGDNNLICKYLAQSTRYLLLLFVPMAMIMAVTSSNLISLIYSSVYTPAGPILSILIFSSLFLVIFMVLLTVINGSNNPLLSMLFALFGAALLMASAYFLVPFYGLKGAAYASLAASVISLLIAGTYIYNKLGNFVSVVSLCRIVFCSSALGLIAYFWQPSGIMVIVSYILLFSFYVLLLYLFGELRPQDLKLFKDVSKKFLKRA